YDIGFVQTVTAETKFVTYVGGQRTRWNFPLPLRDGPPSVHPDSDPPWLSRRFRAQAQPGNFHLQMRDSPEFGSYPNRVVDLTSPVSARVRTFPPAPGQTTGPSERRTAFVPSVNALNPGRDARRSIDFSTWLVARRNNPPAPVSSFSTEFLAGKHINFFARA